MKRLFFIFSLVTLTNFLNAQNNVFVFVDVSKSGAEELKKNDAKSIILDIDMAAFSLSKYPSWKLIDEMNTISEPAIKSILSGSGSPLTSNNSVVGIVEIGEYGRHISSKVFSRISPNQDFKTFMSTSYPVKVYKDNCTLIDLPLAWLASYLKSIPISDYYVFIVSDNKQDTKCQSSFTSLDYKLIADYGKGTNQLKKIATLQGNAGGQILFITIWKINLANIVIPPNTGTGIIIPPPIIDSTITITITSPPKAKKNKE